MNNRLLYIYAFITLLLCNVTGFAQEEEYLQGAESTTKVSAVSLYSGDQSDIWSPGSIVTADIVNPGARIHYTAANTIVFTTGFQALEGSVVIAEIGTPKASLKTETDQQQLFDKESSLDDLVSVYPNNSKGIVNIETKGLEYPVQLNVFDYTGKVILNREIEQGLEQIDLSSNLKGIYIIKLDVAGKAYTNKIILY